MADWGIVTEGAKVVKDSVSLWPQIITAVSTIAAALGGGRQVIYWRVYMTAYYQNGNDDGRKNHPGDSA